MEEREEEEDRGGLPTQSSPTLTSSHRDRRGERTLAETAPAIASQRFQRRSHLTTRGLQSFSLPWIILSIESLQQAHRWMRGEIRNIGTLI